MRRLAALGLALLLGACQPAPSANPFVDSDRDITHRNMQ